MQAASDLVVEVQTAPDPAKWGSLALSLLPFAPTVDGAVLPEAPLEAITDGTPGWAPYTTPNRTTALLTDHVTQVDDPAGDERSLWDGIR